MLETMPTRLPARSETFSIPSDLSALAVGLALLFFLVLGGRFACRRNHQRHDVLAQDRDHWPVGRQFHVAAYDREIEFRFAANIRHVHRTVLDDRLNLERGLVRRHPLAEHVHEADVFAAHRTDRDAQDGSLGAEKDRQCDEAADQRDREQDDEPGVTHPDHPQLAVHHVLDAVEVDAFGRDYLTALDRFGWLFHVAASFAAHPSRQ